MKALLKSTFREITGSFGRYIAILLICALGVGFFSGLKLTKNAMVHSADEYFSELSFYDYKLISTIGFDVEGAADIEKEDIVKLAEAGRSADIIIDTDAGVMLTVKTMSVPEKINKLSLVDGRMPEKDNECVVDGRIFEVGDIGKIICLSEENEDEDLEHFKEKEYTIVGIAFSPLYGSHERGTTALGTGTLDGFVYIPYTAYDMDYDTEIYVCVNGEHGIIYSEEYDMLVTDTEKEMETICKGTVDARYQRSVAEAEDKISDAEKELADARKEGEKKLSDALDKLENGRKELADGEEALGRAKRKISDGEKTIAAKEEEYKEGKKTYKSNLEKYNKGKTAYSEAKKSYDDQYAAYQKGVKEYEDGKKAYEKSEEEYKLKKEQFEAGKAYLLEEQLQQTEAELTAWRSLLDETKNTLEATKTQLDAAHVKLSEGKKTLEATNNELKAAKKKLNKAKKQLEQAPSQIAAAKKELEKGKSDIAVNETKLADARKELEEGEQDYEEGKQEFDEEIAKSEETIANAKEELSKVEKPDTYVLGRDANVAYASYESDSQIVEGLADVFPAFFFLVAALVCITTMTRMMEEQRTQIGVLKALGYSGKYIVAKYLAYSGSAALFGGLTGYFGGAWLFPYVIWISYRIMYNLGSFHYVLDGNLALLSVFAAFLCSAGTTFVACNQELSEMAASLMRPKAPRVGKRILLERVSIVWKRLKFLDKVSVRNLFRYKKRFFMMTIGIGGCTALLVTGFGLKDSIANVANVQYDEIFIYDMLVNVKEKPVEVSGMEEWMLCYDKSMDITSDSMTKAVNLVVPQSEQEFSRYITMHSVDEEPMDFPQEGEVVLSQDIAKRLDVFVGDTIQVSDSSHRGGTVKVCGIFQNYIGHYAFMSADTFRSLFKIDPEYNTMYVNVAEGTDVHTVSAALLKDEGVSRVSVCADTKDRVANMMKSMNFVVLLVIACSGMLAFIVIFNLNNINITERMREIATIKVLGFYRDETNSYVFRENVAMTFLGGLTGLFIGFCLHAFVMNSIHVDGITFRQRITVFSFVISLIITLGFNWMVSLFMSGKLEGINMAESLKSVD